jgi:hypothetical protein
MKTPSRPATFGQAFCPEFALIALFKIAGPLLSIVLGQISQKFVVVRFGIKANLILRSKHFSIHLFSFFIDIC